MRLGVSKRADGCGAVPLGAVRNRRRGMSGGDVGIITSTCWQAAAFCWFWDELWEIESGSEDGRSLRWEKQAGIDCEKSRPIPASLQCR